MKNLILLVSLFIGMCPLYSQKDISGVYANEHSFQIHLKNNMLYYIIPQQHNPVYNSDTLAICSYKWINNEFIELNSEDYRKVALNSININQNWESNIDFGKKIIFELPYTYGPLDIEIGDDKNKKLLFSYSQMNKEVFLPNFSDNIWFTLSPGDKIKSHPDEKYNGLLYFTSYDIRIEEPSNTIKVEIPAINDSFFERYYVIGEYAYIQKNTITWRGETFVKRK